MDDWRRQQISSRLQQFAKWRHLTIERVASIKLRFMKSRTDEGQIYLGRDEYQIVDPAIQEFLPAIERGDLEYEHHESGPEIIGMAADLVVIAGGLWGAWGFIKSKSSSHAKAATGYIPFEGGAASLSIEVRRTNKEGEVVEKRVKLLTAKSTISETEFKSALKLALNMESDKDDN